MYTIKFSWLSTPVSYLSYEVILGDDLPWNKKNQFNNLNSNYGQKTASGDYHNVEVKQYEELIAQMGNRLII